MRLYSYTLKTISPITGSTSFKNDYFEDNSDSVDLPYRSISEVIDLIIEIERLEWIDESCFDTVDLNVIHLQELIFTKGPELIVNRA